MKKLLICILVLLVLFVSTPVFAQLSLGNGNGSNCQITPDGKGQTCITYNDAFNQGYDYGYYSMKHNYSNYDTQISGESHSCPQNVKDAGFEQAYWNGVRGGWADAKANRAHK